MTYNNRNKYRGLKEVDLNQLYRSLDYLADNADAIKKHVYKKQKAKGICDVVFFDVTTLHFESQKEDLLRDFGYSKNCKFNEVQIILCLLVDASGKPLSYELFPGNTFEGAALIPALKRLYEQFEINKLVIVADRGIDSKANLEAIRAAGYDYIVGARLRSASKELQSEALKEDGYSPLRCEIDENDTRKYKLLQNGNQEWVVLHSKKRAEKDQSDRARLVDKAKDMLQSNSLTDKRGAKKFIKTTKNDKAAFYLDEEKIDHDSKFDGYYAISFSDRNLSAEMVVSAYHGLWIIEENFRTLKSFFEVRPIFHWSKKRIEGHILMNFLLLAMENDLLENCKKTFQNHISHNIIRAAIDKMEVSILKVDTSLFASYAPIYEHQSTILKAMKIPEPKNHKIQL